MNASHCQFIPPPSFSYLLYPPPITHPSSSLLACPIPQTNQFACLSSILLPMPAPTLSFVLYCNLQSQRPSINLNFMLPSFTSLTHPSPFLIYFSRRTLIQPLLLIMKQFHSEFPCLSVSNCKTCDVVSNWDIQRYGKSKDHTHVTLYPGLKIRAM